MSEYFRGVWFALFFSALFFLAAMRDDGTMRPDKVWMAAGFSLLFMGVALSAAFLDWRRNRRDGVR